MSFVLNLISNLAIKTWSTSNWRRSRIFIVTFEQIQHNIHHSHSSVFIYNFENVFACCVYTGSFTLRDVLKRKNRFNIIRKWYKSFMSDPNITQKSYTECRGISTPNIRTPHGKQGSSPPWLITNPSKFSSSKLSKLSPHYPIFWSTG